MICVLTEIHNKVLVYCQANVLLILRINGDICKFLVELLRLQYARIQHKEEVHIIAKQLFSYPDVEHAPFSKYTIRADVNVGGKIGGRPLVVGF